MSTIPYPSGGIPFNYLVGLSYDNAKCPTTQFTQPSGGNLIEATTGIIETTLCTTPVNDLNNSGCSCVETNQPIPMGYCYPLTTSTGSNGGSVIYYYAQTCTIGSVTEYFCLYQFYDSSTQNCANVKSVTGIYLNSAGTTGTCFQEGTVKQPIANYLTLSSSPSSYWTKLKGITSVTSIGGCKGTVVGYNWASTTCQNGGNGNGVDDYQSSVEYYCTTDGLKYDYFYGSTCNKKVISFYVPILLSSSS